MGMGILDFLVLFGTLFLSEPGFSGFSQFWPGPPLWKVLPRSGKTGSTGFDAKEIPNGFLWEFAAILPIFEPGKPVLMTGGQRKPVCPGPPVREDLSRWFAKTGSETGKRTGIWFLDWN